MKPPPRPLPTLATVSPAANCKFVPGSCGTRPAHGLSPDELHGKVKDHPCYSEEAHHHFARIHLPVAPACNIQCHYCNRKYDCAAESRPGVTSERLTPEEAVARVLAVAERVPQLSVVGIAGPGDPLANPGATFRTLELVRAAAPDLKLCVSTNGLALPDHVARLAELGVEHVTVTINMVDPEVGERIYPWIHYQGRRIRGREASRILSERQLEGLALLAERKLLSKVNSVVIPGVNEDHLPAVARRIRALGAFLHNVMPLISAPEHGTHYGLTGQRGPTDAELEAVRRSCEASGGTMRHCRQCRADAVGLLGEDRSGEPGIAARARAQAEPAAAEAARAGHKAAVERTRARLTAARDEALAALPPVDRSVRARVAVATHGDGLVNEHFGHAREFLVYEASAAGARLLAIRKVEHYCRGGEGEDEALDGAITALSDCAAILVARIGRCPRERLAAAGIEPDPSHAFEPIEASVLKWFGGWCERLGRGEVVVRACREPVPIDLGEKAIA